jgi:hypothetical protein
VFNDPQPTAPVFGGPNAAEPPKPGRDRESGRDRKSGGSRKARLLIGGAIVIIAVAIAGVIAVPKVLGPTDPGCKAYSGIGLTAYNQLINDLNAQQPQAKLTADMSAAISDLTSAANQAQSATVKSALDGLVTELTSVQGDVKKGSVPQSTVRSLNNAASAADSAC